MPIVAGVDFGTLSVRVTLLDSDRDSSGKVRGRLGTATAEYPLHRRREDPDYATQSHDDQMDALSQFLNWRTTAETEVKFNCDWGPDYGNPGGSGTAILGAPSPEDLLGYLGR